MTFVVEELSFKCYDTKRKLCDSNNSLSLNNVTSVEPPPMSTDTPFSISVV